MKRCPICGAEVELEFDEWIDPATLIWVKKEIASWRCTNPDCEKH